MMKAAAPRRLHYSAILALMLGAPLTRLCRPRSLGVALVQPARSLALGHPDQLDGESARIYALAADVHGVAHNRERARRLRAAARGAACRLLGGGVVAGAAGDDLAGSLDAGLPGGAGGRPAPRRRRTAYAAGRGTARRVVRDRGGIP